MARSHIQAGQHRWRDRTQAHNEQARMAKVWKEHWARRMAAWDRSDAARARLAHPEVGGSNASKISARTAIHKASVSGEDARSGEGILLRLSTAIRRRSGGRQSRTQLSADSMYWKRASVLLASACSCWIASVLDRLPSVVPLPLGRVATPMVSEGASPVTGRAP